METQKGQGNGVFVAVVTIIVLLGSGIAFFLYKRAKKGQEVKKDEVK